MHVSWTGEPLAHITSLLAHTRALFIPAPLAPDHQLWPLGAAIREDPFFRGTGCNTDTSWRSLWVALGEACAK